ncbi:DUF6226 family protein [Leifsonia sp. YAF41]|uniref:DUF6226 family protein n=1 Tax=Leifsonia sp. YAF41 TaxID=3233086 RepID=UPI003F97188F
MVEYARPPIRTPSFRDASGDVINYGHRWADGMPPEDSYTVVSNLDRYAPLHVVAEALIEHLERRYLVTVSHDLANAADILHHRDDILRVTKLTPMNVDAAALTFVFTAFPSVIVHAGALLDLLYPVCGCDACDEDVVRLATDLEWQSLAVTAGNFQERYRPGATPWFGFSLNAVDGSGGTGGDSAVEQLTAARRAMATELLLAAPNGWTAWRPRA